MERRKSVTKEGVNMLTKRQQKLYKSFYESTHENEYLDQKTEVLVGLSAAMAMNCPACMRYYLEQAKKANISKGEISEVLAKVMVVAAGQKRLQMQGAVDDYGIDIESFE
jgi:alkylhydroperoxidase/carboxymuconolactone decarboxylase family protein YurZ